MRDTDHTVDHIDLHGTKILIAEDIGINARIVAGFLKEAGADCDIVDDGTAAVAAYLKHPEGYYDLILMDLCMNDMDGCPATEQIRTSRRKDSLSLPIIALSAAADERDLLKEKEAGMNGHLCKPVDRKILLATVKKYTQK